MRKLLTRALLSSACLTLTACSTPIVGTASQVCDSWRIVSISKDDKLTDRTKREIAGNNVASEQWCGPRPVAKDTPAVAKATGAPVS